MITRELRVGGKIRKFQFEPIVEKCEGCKHVEAVEDAQYCVKYHNPAAMWKDDNCLGATHVETKIVAAAEKKVNPLKASKRASRGK
jgi:hypothetical protein